MLLKSTVRSFAIASLVCVSCSDVVIGQFDGTGSGDGTTTSASSTTASSTSTIATATTTTSAALDTTTEETGSDVPYTCFSDDFEDGIIDEELWNTWVEEDSAVQEVSGRLEFTPPSFGVFDAGVISRTAFEFPFEDGRAQVQLGMLPPVEHPAGLFLIVSEEPDVTIISAGTGGISVRRSQNDAPIFNENFPVESYPERMSIRVEDSVMYFEISDDGITWTTLTTSDQEQPYTAARALIMAQTFGENLDQATIAAADFKVCYR